MCDTFLTGFSLVSSHHGWRWREKKRKTNKKTKDEKKKGRAAQTTALTDRSIDHFWIWSYYTYQRYCVLDSQHAVYLDSLLRFGKSSSHRLGHTVQTVARESQAMNGKSGLCPTYNWNIWLSIEVLCLLRVFNTIPTERMLGWHFSEVTSKYIRSTHKTENKWVQPERMKLSAQYCRRGMASLSHLSWANILCAGQRCGSNNNNKKKPAA